MAMSIASSPPFVLSLPDASTLNGFAVWKGVYPGFAEAPSEGPGFAGAEWCERSAAAVRQGLTAIAKDQALDYSLTQRNAVLPPLVAALLAARPRLRVLDFGGGAGLGFLILRQAMPAAMTRIDYAVVETSDICAVGRRVLRAQGPTFHESIPDGRPFDIVHSASVLQYIDDWRGAIAAMTAARPAFFSLGDVFGGAFPAFVTLQTYYGSRIRHWLFSLDELIETVVAHGYRLALRLPCHVEVLGRRGPLPMEALPRHLRIPNTHHLLFIREEAHR
ncbi:MAG TPA: methyltransferase, TIGR04325 family [Pseudolabrys sp.]|nr:methyltransferase, TIGR04325 family [Pseudolabrys sp.]